MMMLRYLFLVILTVGCATSSKKTTYKDFSFDIINAKRQQGKCTLESSFNMRQAVNAASACYSTNNMDLTHNLALHMRAINEKAPWGYYFDSLYFSNKGQQKQALWYAKKALERDYKNPLLQYQMGRLNYLSGDVNLALFHFKEAHRLSPNLQEVNYFLAQIYLKNKMYKQANYHFVKSDLKSYKDEKLTGRYLTALQLGEYQYAIDSLQAISKNKLSNAQHVDLAFLKEKVGKIDEALDAYKYVLKANKWENTTHTQQQIADKIKDLELQARAIANASEEKGRKK